jgi:hypothetical protein
MFEAERPTRPIHHVTVVNTGNWTFIHARPCTVQKRHACSRFINLDTTCLAFKIFSIGPCIGLERNVW